MQLEDKNQTTIETESGTLEEQLDDAHIAELQKQRFGGPLGWFLGKLFESGAEARGIERVLENERKQVRNYKTPLAFEKRA